jgi:hypothetical protein
MRPPYDPRYYPEPELVPVPIEAPPPTKQRVEDEFWEKNAGVPLDEIFERVVPKTPALPN